jgi:hypothetical protein
VRGLIGDGLLGGATSAAEYPAYHVILAGQGLILDQNGYDRGVSQQFAAKLSTSGTTQNDRLGDQQLLLNDWGGGEGLVRMGTLTATDRYRRGEGINVYDEDSVVSLGPYLAAPANLQTAFNSITCMARFKGWLVIGTGDGKVYRWDGTNLQLSQDLGKSTGGITSMCIYKGVLYISNGQDGVVSAWDGATLTTNYSTAFTVPNTTQAGTVSRVDNLLIHFNGANYNIWCSVSGAAGSVVGYPTSPTAYTEVLQPFSPSVPTMRRYKGMLVVFAADPTNRWTWVFTIDGAATPSATFHTVYEGDAVKSSSLLHGSGGDRLFVGGSGTAGGPIYQWDGSELRLIRVLNSPDFPYSTDVTNMVEFNGALWIATKDSSGSAMGLVRFDGAQSWSRPVAGLSGTTPGPLAVFNNQLHYATSATGASKVFRTDGTSVASGSVESALQNANLSGTGKLWQGVQINHSALISGQSVQVQYKLDDTGSWVTLGTSSTIGATSAEFNFPSPVIVDQIAFKILLAGAAGSSTPLRVFSLAARYLPSPDVLWEWSLKPLFRGTTAIAMPRADGTAEPLLGEDIAAYIRGLVEDGLPVTLVDLDDTEYTVTIQDYSERLLPSSTQMGASAQGWELEGTLNLRQKVD